MAYVVVVVRFGGASCHAGFWGTVLITAAHPNCDPLTVSSPRRLQPHGAAAMPKMNVDEPEHRSRGRAFKAPTVDAPKLRLSQLLVPRFPR